MKTLTKQEAIEAMENGKYVYITGKKRVFHMRNGFVFNDSDEKIHLEYLPYYGWLIHEEKTAHTPVTLSLDDAVWTDTRGQYMVRLSGLEKPLEIESSISRENALETARFIVHAVNNHCQIVKMLKDLYNAIDSSTELTPELLQRVRKALKNAEQ